jgi:hypothetical protein
VLEHKSEPQTSANRCGAGVRSVCCSTAVLQCCRVAVLQCCRVAVLQSCSTAVLQCCRVAVLQCCRPAVLDCCSAAVLQSCCAAELQCCSVHSTAVLRCSSAVTCHTMRCAPLPPADKVVSTLITSGETSSFIWSYRVLILSDSYLSSLPTATTQHVLAGGRVGCVNFGRTCQVK